VKPAGPLFFTDTALYRDAPLAFSNKALAILLR
jgi:hypothetical protein